MARKPTICDGCGKIKALSNCSGELLCSSCAATAGSISNRPEAVAKMIIKRGMSEKIIEALGVNQVAAVAVESELLEKLSALVSYEGESGDALFAEIERRVQQYDSLDEVCRSYDLIFDELYEIMGVERGKVHDLMAAIRSAMTQSTPVGEDTAGHLSFMVQLREILGKVVCPVQDLLDEVRVGVACGKAIDNVAEALCLPEEFTEDDVSAKVGELIDELSARVDTGPDNANKDDLVAASTALSAICRALGMDEADDRLQYKDIVVGVAQVAAGLEQMERTVEDLATITDAVSFDIDDVVIAVYHSEALVEGMTRMTGCSGNPEALFDTIRAWASEAADEQRILQQKELKIDLQADQLSEAEQKLLADEQVFARIREVIGADGSAPGDLPGAIETLITLSPTPRRNVNRHVDSHLLDLLTEFPQIGVDRIAVLREAV